MSLFIALVVSCYSAGIAHARPAVSIKHTYYSISGFTSHDLSAQMKKAGPGAKSKISGDARTNWVVNWRFGVAPVPGGCRIHSVSTSVQVTFIMPRWKNAADGSPELRERWQNYVQALQKHEDGHRDNGIKAAQEIESVLAGLRPMRSCSEMERVANSTGNDILNAYRKRDLYYDVFTIHGLAQGALFR